MSCINAAIDQLIAIALSACGCLCYVDAFGTVTASDTLGLPRYSVGLPDALLN